MSEQTLGVVDTGAGVVSVGNNADTESTRRTVAGRRGGTLKPFDSASAREASARRWAEVSQAARLGIAEAGAQIPDIDKRGPVAVVKYLVTQHTLNAADPSARGATQSFKQVMDLAYPKPEREVAQSASVPAGGATMALSPELARELLAAMRERRAGRAGDGV